MNILIGYDIITPKENGLFYESAEFDVDRASFLFFGKIFYTWIRDLGGSIAMK